jgi:tetratricopeptide (TPR) repeat protein
MTRAREGLNDYRLRDSTPQLQWAIADNKTNHMDVDVGRMRAGEYSERVMGGLDFTLTRWPNHLPALKALIEYNFAGGKPYTYLPAKCYFVRARQFTPDDVDVVLAEAYWTWKKGDREGAKTLYRQALDISPESAEAHYDLGLVHFELADYGEALKHAWAAYAAGYPLPGLKRKLQQAGKWQDPPSAASVERTR